MATVERPPIRRLGSSPAFGVQLGLAALVGGTLVAAGGAHLGIEIAVCLLLGVVTAAPVVLRVWAGEFDLFEPAVIVATVYFVYFVFAPLARFATDDLTFIGRNFEPDYLRALVAALVAALALWLGYAVPVGPEPAPADARPPVTSAAALRRGRQLGWMLLVAAVFCLVVWARLAGRSLLTFFLPGVFHAADEGGGTDIAYLFLAIEWFIPALVLIMAGGGLQRTSRRVAAVLVVTVVYVSIGFRYRIALLWLATAMLTYIQRGQRPRVLRLVVPGAVAFVASGWLTGARLYFRTAGALGTLRFDLRGAVLGGLSDTRIFETFAAVLSTIPRYISYSGPTPFTYVLLLPIPRFIWSEKPLPTSLADVAASVGTAEAPGGGLFVPHFGEYYLAFGWPGIAVGAFLFGMGAKWLWRWYRAAPQDPWRQTLFVLNNALLFQAIIRGYTPQIVMEWCFLVLPAIVMTRSARRRSATPAPFVHA